MDLSVFSGLNETMMIFVEYCDNLTELNLCFLTKYRSMVRDQWWHNLNLQNISYLVNNLTTSIQKISFCSLKCVNDEHIKILVNRCNKITELDLSFTDITNDSVKSIIKYLNCLEKLDVGSTKIDFSTLLELKSIPTLKILRCSFEDEEPPFEEDAEAIKDLKLQLPHIRINEDYLHIACPTKEVNQSIDQDWFWEIEARQQDLFPKAY